MSHRQGAARGDSGDARIVGEHHITGLHGEDETERADDHGRRWYHLRPEPRRRTDFLGFNSTWWMTVAWLILLLGVIFPFPWVW
jgi:hypothetical protein